MTKILVVDDEESIRIVIKETLEPKGFEVDLVADPTEANKLYKGNNYDLVITDVGFGGIVDGIILSQKFRDVKPSQLIIVMSGRLEMYAERIKDLGVGVATLKKPFVSEELFAVVSQVLGRTRCNEG